ncbi:MAG TPA: DUF4082 domain-containing protein [Bryobacteraceae bacterium]|nr:DUF4082 domain-containing protein [Bryobacteraceae bacterium]
MRIPRSMTRMRLPVMGALLLAAWVSASTAIADTVAINVTGLDSGFNYSQGTYLLGFEFQANRAITITQLGFYDSNATGAAETFEDSPVGVYDITTNTLLASATVTASDPLTGFFRYAALNSPIALNTTDTYAIVGISGENYYTADVPLSATTVQVNAAINYVNPAYCSCNTSGWGESSSLVQPGYFPAGTGLYGDFGPNFQFTEANNLPTIGGVSNAASAQLGVAAGTFASIYGTNFAPAGFSDNWGNNNAIVNGQLPATLDGVSVDIGGTPAYVAAVTPDQINVLAPNLGTGSIEVTVTTAAGASAPFAVTADALQPAFFVWPGNAAVATHLDYSIAVKNGTFQTPTVAAKPGEVIILWGTGFGPTTPAAPSGQLVPSGLYGVDGVAVTVGGLAAQVYSVALSPGMAGLYQVAIQVPGSLADGDFPVIATLSGQLSPAWVILTVQQ